MLRRALAGCRRYAVSGIKKEVSSEGAKAAAAAVKDASDEITLTDTAVQRIFKKNSEDAEFPILRLNIVPGGCQGGLYDFAWEKSPNADDHIVTRDGATMLVSDAIYDKVKGAQVDFKYDMLANSFQVLKPGDDDYTTCSCGKSFSL